MHSRSDCHPDKDCVFCALVIPEFPASLDSSYLQPPTALKEIYQMHKILVSLVAALAVTSLSGCGTIGKGKGKAPPPIEEPAAAPVYK